VLGQNADIEIEGHLRQIHEAPININTVKEITIKCDNPFFLIKVSIPQVLAYLARK